MGARVDNDLARPLPDPCPAPPALARGHSISPVAIPMSFCVAVLLQPNLTLIAMTPVLRFRSAFEALNILQYAIGQMNAELPFIADLLQFEDGHK